ncbi:MAG: VOC family protein [Rhodospirillaceae bacterium]|nr:VOC family protein [Rhodospirillaceae bacterium]
MDQTHKIGDSRWGRAIPWLGLALTFWADSAWAEEPRLTPVRRTTIATADPEASLTFYRDLLGFTVEYDVKVTQPGQLTVFAPGATEGRAIALRQGDKLGGSIGLFHTPGLKPAPTCDKVAGGGATAVLILTDNLSALYDRLSKANVPFVNAPHTYDRTRGPTDTFTVFDPNCVRVAFAQIQRESLEQSMNK